MRKKWIVYFILVVMIFGGIQQTGVFAVQEPMPSVYVGGYPVGISLKSRGLIVMGQNKVMTEQGLVGTLEGCDIATGDVLLAVEGIEVESATALTNVINRKEFAGKRLNISLKRREKMISTSFQPVYDTLAGEYKAGLWVREDTLGIGTMTFVKSDNLVFGALGHSVVDPDTKTILELQSGSVFDCAITGIRKGERGKAGELRGVFVGSDSPIGKITKNCLIGIFGTLTELKVNPRFKLPIPVMRKSDVRAGKATILTTLSGNEPAAYEIEIVKVNVGQKSGDKGLVIRITDKTCLEQTGGIVQGMSGSPILQNGKLCGAVTHVFVNDPTRGYAVFAEWMMNE